MTKLVHKPATTVLVLADSDAHLHSLVWLAFINIAVPIPILAWLLSGFLIFNFVSLSCFTGLFGSSALPTSKEKDLKTVQAHDLDKMADSQEKNYKYRQEISQVGLETMISIL